LNRLAEMVHFMRSFSSRRVNVTRKSKNGSSEIGDASPISHMSITLTFFSVSFASLQTDFFIFLETCPALISGGHLCGGRKLVAATHEQIVDQFLRQT